MNIKSACSLLYRDILGFINLRCFICMYNDHFVALSLLKDNAKTKRECIYMLI